MWNLFRPSAPKKEKGIADGWDNDAIKLNADFVLAKNDPGRSLSVYLSSKDKMMPREQNILVETIARLGNEDQIKSLLAAERREDGGSYLIPYNKSLLIEALKTKGVSVEGL